MPLADRTTQGPALSSRLAGRADRVPVAGGSDGFRSRFGLTQAGSRLQALASRLFDRAEGFFASHGAHHLRALERMWPEERRFRAPWDRAGIYRGEMVLPERVAAVGEEEEAEAVAGRVQGKKVFVPHQPVASPWGKSLDAPARVVRGTKTAGQRTPEPRARDVVRKGQPAATARVRKTARSASGRAIPLRTRALDRAAERADEISLLPAAGGRPQASMSRSDTPGPASTPVQRRRPVSAPRGPLARMTAPARSRRLPDRAVSPVAQAASRAAGPEHSRGLRPVLGSSPSVVAVMRPPAAEQVLRGPDPAAAGVAAPSESADRPGPQPSLGARRSLPGPGPAQRRAGRGGPSLSSAGSPSVLDLGARVDDAAQREAPLARASARLDEPATPQTAARADVASGAVSRLGGGDAAGRARSPRRFAVRKMASGVFGPDRVVVAPPVPEPEVGDAAPAAPRRHPGAPPPVVSGFAAASSGVKSTATVVGRSSAGPVAVLDAQAPSAHAARRLQRTGTASVRSVLPALTPDAAQPSARQAPPARQARSAVHRAADRARAAARRAGSLVPSPLGSVVGRAAHRSTAMRSDTENARPGGSASVGAPAVGSALRVGARGRQRRSGGAAVDTSTVVKPGAGVGALEEADTLGTVASRGSAPGPRATVRAAERAGRSASGLGSVRRVMGLTETATPERAAQRSRFSRSGPVSYARDSRTPLLRLDAATAEGLGLFSAGIPGRGAGEWLAEGDLATAVQRAASRKAAPAVSRGEVPRPSSLRYASPDAETVSGAAPAAQTDQLLSGDDAFAGAPVASAWGTSPGPAGTARVVSGGQASSRPPAVRVKTTPGVRPLDAADARTGAAAVRRTGRTARALRPDASGDRPMLAGAASRRPDRAHRSAGAAPDVVLPRSPSPVRGDGDTVEASGRAVAPSLAFQPGVPTASAAGSRGPGLSGLLQQVEQGSADAHLPVWARRASGRPLVRGTPDGLVSALSRASSEEDVVRVLVEEGRDVVTASTLPRPVTEVIKQIRSEATAQVRDAQAEAERELAEAGAPRSEQVATRQASARVIRNMNTLRGRPRSRSGVGPDQVSRLAKKLQGLIHLAEGVGDRDAARRQVRMAEDSAAARAEGQGGDSTRPDTGLQDQVDIDALSREVLEAVSRELELRRERRQEDSDGSFWW